MKLKSFILFSLSLICSSVFGISYYVSPTATSSGTGTNVNPYTLSVALSKALVAGDSLILRGGQYDFSAKVSVTKNGTASQYIHIVNYPGEMPVFDFRTQAYTNAGLSISGSYIHIKGITVQGAGDNGFYVTGNYNFLEQCIARWNCDSGFQLKTGTNNLVVNCDSYENFDYKTGSISSPDFGGNADGFADKQYTNTSGSNKYKGCRSWSNSDDGWDLFEKIGNTEMDSCWCYLNGPASYNMKNNIRFKTDSATWFYQFASTNYVITNYGNGNGFKLGGNYTASNTINRFCLSANNKVKGYDQNNNNGIMQVYNCTGYYNAPDFGFTNASYGTLTAKNNASLSSKSTNRLACKTVTQSNNTWLSGYTNSANDFLSTDHTQMLLTRKSNGNLPDLTFMHQKQTSSMIDKGVNLGLPFAGTNPDLGAFEYSLTSDLLTSASNVQPDIHYVNELKTIFVGDFCGLITLSDIYGRQVLQIKEGTNNSFQLTEKQLKGIYFINYIEKQGKNGSIKILIH